MANWIAAVRHPQKQDDLDGIHRGDQSLITEEGERQAAVLVERARLMDLDAIVSSDTPRAALLAARIGTAINRPVTTSALFREWRAPRFMLQQSVRNSVVQEAKHLMRESFDHDLQHFDEETKSALEARTHEALEYLAAQRAQRLLLVSHANFIAGAITYVVWGSLDGYYRGPDRKLKLSNTGVTVLCRERDRRDGTFGFVVQSVNDVSHEEATFYTGIQRLFDAHASPPA